MEDFINKVVLICKHKYDLEEEVTLFRIYEIEQCYEQNFTPIRTAAVVADHIFN